MSLLPPCLERVDFSVKPRSFQKMATDSNRCVVHSSHVVTCSRSFYWDVQGCSTELRATGPHNP